MKITVFTITDCYFCKQEKDYLKSNNLPFEEKNLEENRDWLTEMLTISNNFAGTPVTKIEKDDGTIVVLKGFTKEEFDETLGIKAEAAKTEAVAQPTAVAAVPQPIAAEEPKVEVAPQPPVVQQAVEQPVVVTQAPVATAPVVPDAAAIAAQIEELKKLQESLMSKPQAVAQTPAPVAPAPQVVQAPAVQAAPQPVAAAPTQNAVDDSLAAILAELQAKINSANSGGTQGQTS